MPLIEIVENDNLDEIENMDSESVLMSGVCLGYIMGMLEGVQVGWASNRDGENIVTIQKMLWIFLNYLLKI